MIQHVPIQNAAQSWGLVQNYLARSQIHAMGDYSLEQIKLYVLTGQWMLLVSVDEDNKIHGAMTIDFINRPNCRVAFITCTGGKMIINEDAFKQLENICKVHGATKIECAARESVARLLEQFGFNKKYTILEVSL